MISAAFSTTWWFVRIKPWSASTITPEPALRKSLRFSRGPPKNRRRSGSSESGLSISIWPRTEILTTAGEVRSIIGARLGNGVIAGCWASDAETPDSSNSMSAGHTAATVIPRAVLA